MRPISPDPSFADPFLLLAHHRHSFSPGDPLRGPFKTVGGALGLPYVGDEGFKMVSRRHLLAFSLFSLEKDGLFSLFSLTPQSVLLLTSCLL